MRVIPPALAYLMRLQWAGRLRRLGKRLKTVKGVISLLVILLLFGVWSVGAYLSATQSNGEFQLTAEGYASGMSVLLLTSLFAMSWDQGLGFRPDEIAFLFSGPFTRRELLRYRMVRDSISILMTALPASIIINALAGSWVGAFLGVSLSLCCLSLSQMLLGVIGATVSQSLMFRGRMALLVVMVVLAGVSIAFTQSSDPAESGGLMQTPLLRAVRLPFIPFARMIVAKEYFPELLGWMGVSIAIVGGLAFCILRVDANFTEAAMAASQRAMERIERMRRGRIGFEIKPQGAVKFGIPPLPRLAGAGPIIWHQLTGALRSFKSMSLFLGLILLAILWPHFTFLRQDHAEQRMQSLLPIGVMFSLFFLPQFLRYDFRGDIERIPFLKSLPIRPLPVVLGELAVPTLILTLLQIIVCAGFTVAGMIPLDRMGMIVVFAPLANALIFGVENLLFLLYPTSLPVPGGPDLDALPKRMLYSILKFLVLGLTGALCAAVGAGLWLLFDESMLAAVAGAWVTGVIAAVIVVWVTVTAYQNFDPSEDMPE